VFLFRSHIRHKFNFKLEEMADLDVVKADNNPPSDAIKIQQLLASMGASEHI
jgi:hypothetical protein